MTYQSVRTDFPNADWLRRQDIPLDTRIAIVREARELFGVGIAKKLWFDLGLPMPADAPNPATDSRYHRVAEDFISSCLIRVDGGQLPAAPAYDAFCCWLRINGQPTLSLTAFGRGLRSNGVGKCRTAYGTMYLGFSLKQTPKPP